MNEPESELVVYPGEGRYALAYKVHLAGSPAPQSWRVFVDAQTGSVLEKENATMHLASILKIFRCGHKLDRTGCMGLCMPVPTT